MPRRRTCTREASALALHGTVLLGAVLLGATSSACTNDDGVAPSATRGAGTGGSNAGTGGDGTTGGGDGGGGAGGEARCEGHFERSYPRIVDPRELVSPSTGDNTVAVTADPCAVWDPQIEKFRVFFTFADFTAEEQNLPPAGIFGGTWAPGEAFEPYETLALDQIGTFDTYSVETCDVVRIDDETSATGQRFFMYYGGASQEEPDYTIALATSEDGRRFEPIPPNLSPRGALGELFKIDSVLPGAPDVPGNYPTDPTVVIRDDTWHMWTFCVQQFPDGGGGVCHSTSLDGINWQHFGPGSGLTRGAPIQPTVHFNPSLDAFEMYVVMDTPEEEAEIHDVTANLTLRVVGWFRAVSEDGMTWTPDPERGFCEDLSRPWEDAGVATGADAAIANDTLYFFYPSFTTMGRGTFLPGLMNWPLNVAERPLDSVR
ncbi:MAG: hypothetical protein AAF715_03020 [Myxococcota bacterium]